MDKVREMNDKIFKTNLLMAVNEILEYKNLNINEFKFTIDPIYEPNKSLDSMDDIMRLIIFSEKNIGGKIFSIDETVKLMTVHQPFVPIWINVIYLETIDNYALFKLETSLRVRKPSLLRNAETLHPPFKAILQ